MKKYLKIEMSPEDRALGDPNIISHQLYLQETENTQQREGQDIRLLGFKIVRV